MALDWLYGPRKVDDGQGRWRMRAYRLDVDSLLDLAVAVDEAAGSSEPLQFWETVPRVGPRRIAREDLAALSGRSLNSLYTLKELIDEPTPQATYSATFYGEAGPTVMVAPPTGRWIVLEDLTIDLLERYGQPRVHWFQLLRFAPLLFVLVMTAFWIWTEAVSDLLPPVHVIGWLAVVALLGLAGWAYVALGPLAVARRPNHLILEKSRKDLRDDRANSRRDVKVAALTVIGTLIVAVLGLLLFGSPVG